MERNSLTQYFFFRNKWWFW